MGTLVQFSSKITRSREEREWKDGGGSDFC
jgi:hypothetical protein